MTNEYTPLHRNFAAFYEKQEAANAWSSVEERMAAFHLMMWLGSLAKTRGPILPPLIEALRVDLERFHKAHNAKPEGKPNGAQDQ